MLIDGGLSFRSDDVGAEARELELAATTEPGRRDRTRPLLIVAGAATATTTLNSYRIVVAFARSPMITATMANDVQLLSRAMLLAWVADQTAHREALLDALSHPAPRMREYVLAMRLFGVLNEAPRLTFVVSTTASR